MHMQRVGFLITQFNYMNHVVGHFVTKTDTITQKTESPQLMFYGQILIMEGIFVQNILTVFNTMTKVLSEVLENTCTKQDKVKCFLFKYIVLFTNATMKKYNA